jgi:esterase/lipase superfamily enzyme
MLFQTHTMAVWSWVMTVSRLLAFSLVMLMLAGCGGRAVLGLDARNVIKASAAVPAPVTNEQTGPKAVLPIFVATSRQRSDDLSLPYSSKRSPTLNFARFDIGIPPKHKNGEVEKSSNKPNPAHDFAATTFQPYNNGQTFIDRINAELAKRPADKREIFIFVHGYNNNFADGVFREAQIAYDYGLPAVAVHYSWPSAAALGLYVYDRDSATFGREGLAELLRLVTRTNAKRILLVGHSMGSFVVMEALTKLAETGHRDVLRHLSGVMLAAPDIDVDVFQAQAANCHDPLPYSFPVLTAR